MVTVLVYAAIFIALAAFVWIMIRRQRIAAEQAIKAWFLEEVRPAQQADVLKMIRQYDAAIADRIRHHQERGI